MLQLILHGIGDYFLQTDYQALNKKKKGWNGLEQCVLHCLTYSLPFKFIGSWSAVAMIFVTHFIIDRTNIVAYFLAWKNDVRKYYKHDSQGYLMEVEKKDATVIKDYDISNFGFGKERPFAISIWLYIICDNLCHVICNYIILRFL